MKHSPTKEITDTAVTGKQHAYKNICTEEGWNVLSKSE